MDFIERHLGFAPDHGNGSLEAVIFTAQVTVVTGLGMGYFSKRHLRD